MEYLKHTEIAVLCVQNLTLSVSYLNLQPYFHTVLISHHAVEDGDCMCE